MSSTERRIEFGEAEWIASYGFELLPVPAHCARLQLREVQRRWAMWGLHGNTDVEVYEGDFRVLPEVPKRLREADVVVSHTEHLHPTRSDIHCVPLWSPGIKRKAN